MYKPYNTIYSRLHQAFSVSRRSSSAVLELSDIKKQLLTFTGGDVTLTKKNFVGVISVSHPEKRNAFTGEMCVKLHDIVSKLADWKEGKAVIIRGMQGMFCSGADLTMAKQIADSKNGERFSYFMQKTLSDLRKLHLISYALLRGSVVGGGAEIMVACDFSLGTQCTKVTFVQGRMGIVPGWGGATHLYQKVGYSKALDLLLTSRNVELEEAIGIGLVDASISTDQTNTDEDFLEAGLKYVEDKIGHLPADVIRGLKAVCVGASTLDYHNSMVNERNIFKSLWGGEANLKALSRVKQKN